MQATHETASAGEPPGPGRVARLLAFAGVARAIFGNNYTYDSSGPVAELLTRQLGFNDTQSGSLNAI